MAVGDFMESEVGIAVATTAVVLSPRVRGLARRGLVLGLAGMMKAADAVGGAARSVGQEAQSQAGADGAPDARADSPKDRSASRAGGSETAS
jgi:hypothetical protein